MDVQAKKIADDKDLRKPFRSDWRELRVASGANDPTEEHVGGGCVEERSEEDEARLNDVGHQGSSVRIGVVAV